MSTFDTRQLDRCLRSTFLGDQQQNSGRMVSIWEEHWLLRNGKEKILYGVVPHAQAINGELKVYPVEVRLTTICPRIDIPAEKEKR